MNYKAKMVAVFIATFVTATCVSAESTDWFVVAEGAFENGGNVSRADALGNLFTFPPSQRGPETADSSSRAGRFGIGRRVADRFRVTLYVGTSTSMQSTYSASTKPIGAPASTVVDSRLKKDHALLTLGYRFYESERIVADAALGLEVSRNRLKQESVSTFVFPSPVVVTHRSTTKTAPALDVSVGFRLSPGATVGPFARILDDQRSQLGIRFTYSF